jgi:hypothetical protein
LVFPSSIFDSRSTIVNDGPLVFLLPTTYLSFLSFDFVRRLYDVQDKSGFLEVFYMELILTRKTRKPCQCRDTDYWADDTLVIHAAQL